MANPEKRKAGDKLRPNFDKTPIGPRCLSDKPGAIMRLPFVECQSFWQQFLLFSNDRADKRQMV
jgi:hypothetical protein